MPIVRLFGNAALSFLSKLSTGYWRVFDPNNGFTAIHAKILRLIPLDKIHQGYFFESDMLFRLNTVRAAVIDVPMRAVYGTERSSLTVAIALPVFTVGSLRVISLNVSLYNYFLRDFHVASLEWLLGPPLLAFGLVFGLYSWITSAAAGVAATAGTVMLAGLPFIVGLQLLLSAISFDIENSPTRAVHPLLDDETPSVDVSADRSPPETRLSRSEPDSVRSPGGRGRCSGSRRAQSACFCWPWCSAWSIGRRSATCCAPRIWPLVALAGALFFVEGVRDGGAHPHLHRGAAPV